MSKAQNRSPSFRAMGTWGVCGDGALISRELLESGPTVSLDSILQFKARLWERLFKGRGPYDDERHWHELHARLRNKLDPLSRALYVVLEAGSDRARWEALAREFEVIPFVELENGESYIKGTDEHLFADIVNTFLKMAFPAERTG